MLIKSESIKMSTIHKLLAPLILAVLMSGCANASPPNAHPAPTLAVTTHGVISDIETVREGGDKIGTDTLIGGTPGGVIGNQASGASGNNIAAMAGVIGGEVVGHQIDKNANQQEISRIKIHFEHGEHQTVTQSASDLRVGDRVRVENNQVTRDQ
jgi:outer membrane lipoprotein SlyB